MQYAFTLRFPHGHPHHKDPIKLCFEDEEAANEWQATLAKAIRRSDGGELQSHDTGNVLQDMDRKTQDIEHEEQTHPTPDTPRSVSRNHSLVSLWQSIFVPCSSFAPPRNPMCAEADCLAQDLLMQIIALDKI